MTNNLPPGPWSYDADANCVRSAIGVAFCMANKALADILIRGEREADETPIDAAWLVSLGGDERGGDAFTRRFFFNASNVQFMVDLYGPDGSYGMLSDRDAGIFITVSTRGTFRTAMRMLGIDIKEPT